MTIWRSILLLFVLSVPIGVAASADGENILRVGVQLEPPNLDPTIGSAAAVDDVVYANIFEGLTGIAANGEVVPRLASRWTISADGLRYRFFLREGVRFHDGSVFDADDVIYTLQRARAPDSTNAQKSLFEPIVAVEASDAASGAHTVDIVLSRPVGAFLQHLAWGDAVIVAAETAASNANLPVGTGPFRFLRWRKGIGIDIVRNDDYWGSAAEIDGVTFQFIPDPSAAFASLMAGDVDGFPDFPAPENLAQFDSRAEFEVRIGTTEGETILALNNGVPPFDDLRVRRALSHAIDKTALIDGAVFGYGKAIGSHFPPHHRDYVELSDRYPYDPARARSLLAEAGFENGFDTVLKLPPPSYARRSGEVIAAQLAAVGVRARIENLEWAQWLDQVFGNKNYALTIVAHTEPLDLDIYARDGYYFQYDNADYREIIRALSTTSDADERSTLYQRAQRKLSDDAVNVYLFQRPKLGVWARGVDGTWANAPLQANDFTSVTRQGLDVTTRGAANPQLSALLLLLLGGAAVAGFVYLASRAGLTYLLRRVASIVVTMLVATVVIFLLIEIAPGDPAAYMMGLNAEPEALSALREELGLSKSVPQRYFAWLGGLLTGDLGTSYTYRAPVTSLIAERLQVSLPLALYSICLAIALAVPAGIVAARRRGQASDVAVMGVTQIGIALPNFWIAMLLVLVFASGLRWFPVGGFPGWDAGVLACLRALTLPAIALAVPQAAILARVMRSALLETLGEDYIRTARSKGLSAAQALQQHALRNAAIPVLTILGLQLSFLLAGGIIIENVFYLPGLGRLVFQAIVQRDLIVVEGVVLLLAFATVFIAFVVDLGYAAIDPRLRQSR